MENLNDGRVVSGRVGAVWPHIQLLQLILPQSVIVSFLRLYQLRLSILFNEMSQH